MLAQYPSSDLSDDADWMVRNIRSGGKLMPVLEGDSGYVAPDSAAAKTGSKSMAATRDTAGDGSNAGSGGGANLGKGSGKGGKGSKPSP